MKPLTAAVVGLRGLGLGHARGVAAAAEFELVAGCDLEERRRQRMLENFPGTRVYSEFGRMLKEVKPEMVVIATNTVTHAALTVEAAEAGARGVFLEKPMSVSLGEARREIGACQARGVALVVNHQRRTTPPYLKMRKLVEEGAVGKVELIRGSCAGDFLSDGTHTVDSLRFLAGDIPVKWVLGQVCRDRPDPHAPRGSGFDASGGWRYGHPIETGAMAVFEFENGVRGEITTGSMWRKGWRYQDIEVIGDKGRLWRAGDAADPPLRIQDDRGGGWRPVEVEPDAEQGEVRSSSPLRNYRRFARMILERGDHPLSGESGLRDQEIVMAVYESARLRARIELPLTEERFPLAVMIEDGQL